MDVETIDSTYSQLQTESQQTGALITALAGKLSAAAATGDPNAREWMLDLREITLGVQNEETQTANLLQALHGFFVGNMTQQTQPVAYQQQPQYAAPQQQYQPSGGGMMQRFMGGGFGRAIATGAGFGIGDDLINKIF